MTAPMVVDIDPGLSAIVRDEARFRAWYDAVLPRVYRYLLARCGDEALAEELTQQTFVEAVLRRDRFDGRSEATTWLIAIGRNKLVDHYRRGGRDAQRHVQLVHEQGVETDAPWRAVETREAILVALGQLPGEQRIALLFRHLDGLSVRDVAAAIGRSEKATESLLARARESSAARMEAGPMHDDQLRDLFRNLEDDREPDAGFGDALFRRLGEVSRRRPQSRTPVLLLAAALLLTALAAGMALGSGWLRLPQTAEATQTPEPSPSASAVAVASPTPPAASAETSPSAAPSAAPGPVDVAGGVLFVEADGLRVRSEASGSAEIRATLRRGQLMGATGAITSVDGMDWYEVRIGPGPLEGWVAAGPDGAWLRLVDDGAIAFYCGDCGDEPAVVSITPDGDDAVTTIATAPDLQDWAWSPDGTRLAATAVGATGTSVVVMDPDGSAREEIGPGGWAPHWSPTGRLVWTTESGLVVTDEGLNPTQLDLDLRNVGGALWSPDGLRLAFSGIDCNNADCPDGPIVGDPPSAVYTVGADGDDLVQLTAGMYDGLSGWAPDGSRVAINRHDLSGEFPPRALTVPSDGGEETFLLDGGAVVSRATWSPDGSRMAISTPDGLVVMDGDGSNARVIVPAGETGIWEMAWSPSGRQILLGTGGSSAGTGLDLFLVSPDGGEPIPITPEEQESRSGVWQPILVPLP